MAKNNYVIGLDFGSDSCRAIIVNALSGNEIASAVKYYPRWMKELYCDPAKNQYRQHPLDYIEAMEYVIKESLSKAPADIAKDIVGISFDTTGSTPVLTDKHGTPLALLPEFSDNPNAMFVLWKDHTAIEEAIRINTLAKENGIDYTAYEGGIYSSEWVWAKVAHLLTIDPAVRQVAYSWIEHCDWMPALITGRTKPEEVVRSRCAAGHKAMWNEKWGGLPSEEFLAAVSPYLARFRDHLYTDTYTCDTCVGTLTQEWAARLGLPEHVAVGVGAIDCHMGAVGAGITPYSFVRVIGTSTCDIMVVTPEELADKLIPGICGQVDGSVVPNLIGLEAGQSAFGDIYAWFKKLLAWPLENILSQTQLVDEETKQKLIQETSDRILPILSEKATEISVHDSTVLATDWLNGRRTPYASPLVKGTITGLNLGSTAPLIFRALVEATAFGSKAIVDHFRENNIRIDQVIGIGGISLKSPFVMQTLADVLNMPIKVAKAEQACALGASMFAAVAAGIYKDVESAQKAMGLGFAKEYIPNKENHEQYKVIYEHYKTLGKLTEKELLQ